MVLWQPLARMLAWRAEKSPPDPLHSTTAPQPKAADEALDDEGVCLNPKTSDDRLTGDSSSCADSHLSESDLSMSEGEESDGSYDDYDSRSEPCSEVASDTSSLSADAVDADLDASLGRPDLTRCYTRSQLLGAWRSMHPKRRARSFGPVSRRIDDSKGASLKANKASDARSELPPRSSKSWAEVQRQRREGQDPAQGSNDIGRSVKSILNKLTVEKFDELCTKLMQCGFCTQAHVQMLVRAILEEAQLSRSHSGVYADLCVRLIAEFGDAEYLIKRALRIECRQLFDQFLQCSSPAASTQVLDEEAEQEALLARKIRFLGHVRFMGQLLTRYILSHQELFSCTVDLLKRPLQSSSVEALSVLLGVVGPTFDTDTWPQRSKLQTIFLMLSDLSTDPEVSTRVRYLIRDLLELRDSRWIDRKQVTRVELPKRLDEVRQNAEETSNTRADRRSHERRGVTGNRGGTGGTDVRHSGEHSRVTRASKSSAEMQEPSAGEAPRRRRRRGGERERRRRQR